MTHRGGCHCRRVVFEVDAPRQLLVQDCNCSLCRMSGFWHLIVPASRFRLLRGADDLVEYTFNTGVAKHRFCRVCGIKSFYIPRSNPDGGHAVAPVPVLSWRPERRRPGSFGPGPR